MHIDGVDYPNLTPLQYAATIRGIYRAANVVGVLSNPTTKLTADRAEGRCLMTFVNRQSGVVVMIQDCVYSFVKEGQWTCEGVVAQTVFDSTKQPAGPRKLVKFATDNDLAQAVAKTVATASEQAIAQSGRFTIAFSGGSVPAVVCAGLLALESKIDYAKWHVYFCDERFVALDHPDSNYKAVKEGLLDKVPIKHVYSLDPATLTLDVSRAAQAYENMLRANFGNSAKFPALDMVLLGMGPDGHTCSLFPGHELLGESTLWVAPIKDSPKPPSQRITLTLPLLNNAKAAVFICVGNTKRGPLKEIFGGCSKLPAALVTNARGVQFFADEAAAGDLA